MSCDQNCNVAAYQMPCIVEGTTLYNVLFEGTPEGVVSELEDVRMKVSGTDDQGVLMEIDSGEAGGITITDPSNWSFRIDQIAEVNLPAGCLDYSIFFTLADGTKSAPFQGKWNIKAA